MQTDLTEHLSLDIPDKTVSVDSIVDDFRYKTQPLDHQRRVFRTSRDRQVYALFMDQGTGKTKVAIDTAAYLRQRDEIDAVFVVCPRSMVLTWTDIEFPKHLPDHIFQFSKFIPFRKKLVQRYSSSLDTLYPHTDLGLRGLVINPESLIQKGTYAFCERFVRTNRTLIVVDESQSIKNGSSKRTKALLKLKNHSLYRRIMTGTPIANNILDLYSQFCFLDEEILGYYSYYAFRNHFAIMKKMQYGKSSRPFDQVVGFQNTDELKARIADHSYRVLKKECLDLPDKVYETRLVELPPAQRRIYDQMKKQLVAELDALNQTTWNDTIDMNMTAVLDAQEIAPDQGVEIDYRENVVTASHAAVALVKLHQIVSGWVKNDSREIVSIGSENPKLETLLDVIEDELEYDQKVLIWAVYRHDIELIVKTLQEKYGQKSAAAFYGGTKRDERQKIINDIQDTESKLRFFVGHPKAGGAGITLTGASVVIYYSNTYDLVDRLQSEDRAHRIGQTKQVTYIDIIAKNTVDEKILAAVQNKVNLAKAVVKMDYKELLS